MNEKVAVVGSGFSGLVAAASLAKAGYEVVLLEKNTSLGGRARHFKKDGFTFDMGPSWYWMPDVFEQTFESLGYKVSEFFKIDRLDPSYTVFFKDSIFEVPASLNELKEKFENIEKGSGAKLQQFMDEAAYKYKVGMEEFVWKPSHSIAEYMDLRLFSSLFKLQMLRSLSSVVRKKFQDDRIRQILEFPVLFLGATPWNIPAMYSLMNHADLSLGTWYPRGGMSEIVKALEKIIRDLGVTVLSGNAVQSAEVSGNKITKLTTSGGTLSVDFVINSSDYHHFEQEILPESHRVYSESYWQKRVMAPSSLLFYIGVDEKIPNIHHHNLFFDEDFNRHAVEIYEKPAWPDRPLFYACCPSKSDPEVAPAGKENLFLLMPIAPGLNDDKEKHLKYFDIMMDRLESRTDFSIRDKILFKKSYCLDDFSSDYNAFKGNAYGLANTLGQTAFLKPKMKNKKIANLLNCGQLTTPGPGVPPALISGRLAAIEAMKIMNSK